MKLVTFSPKGIFSKAPKVGILVDGTVIDVFPHLSDFSMKQFLAGGAAMMTAASQAAQEKAVAYPLAEVTLHAPIPDPDKIICIGLNYKDHAAECGLSLPDNPLVFSKYNTAIVGPGETVQIPPISSEVDYEVELVVVIGKEAKNVSEAEALSYVAGYTVGNDVSARDWQLKKGGGQWNVGKSFDTFAPIGPAICTSDEVGDPHKLAIKCTVNDKVMQDSNTNQLHFRIDKLVSFLSSIFTLKPGDIIFTGTPPGVGMAQKPPLWIKPGDVMTCEIEKLGALTNPCA
jgi:2-keto-4-pentenoate hydratase/2-oxohepta-3-ene-1,7-dioic acid hydratase in catechol pathway